MDGSNIKTDYPVVLRFEGLYPHQLGGYEAHRLRKGGDLGHVDRSRTKLNGPPLIGPEDWAARALAEIREMAAENFAAEVASLEKRNRKKDIERRFVEGPKQPWRPTRHGPMREVILTVNKDWFDADLSKFFGEAENQREKEFGALAKQWLIENFGDDVIHARADRDEAAFHIHAVIMPRATVEIAKPKAKVPTATATRRMLQPSIHPLIENYEAAQDSVGEWFASLGLVRGERRAAAIKEARANGQTPPKRRYHAKTWKWRVEEELRLKAEAETLETDKAALDERSAHVTERENEAETVLAVAEGVASGAFVASEGEDEPGLIEAPTARPAETPLEDLRRRSPTGFARATGVFGRAWGRLFGQARAKAEAEADSRVANAMEQIERADAMVAEATRHLPSRTRLLIGEIRQTIPAILRKLERSGKGLSGSSENVRPQRDEPGDEEKF
ncbi:Pre (Mob) type recombination enzyme [Mesobaculum littorinae]|uniref:Pre (Mob) type recombination enzyme n=1 Tax=Mesobaculum littorinae TaxID=2486419 RepID=A0A438ACW1_9RHOB|nr:plasmid recombination protein [Mesobaculum littorinae]RVV96519.1 Pre (Mob) type recombination enzyme [Mesobaculum littorinae]